MGRESGERVREVAKRNNGKRDRDRRERGERGRGERGRLIQRNRIERGEREVRGERDGLCVEIGREKKDTNRRKEGRGEGRGEGRRVNVWEREEEKQDWRRKEGQ